MTLDQLLAWCAVIVAVGAAGTVLVKAVRWVMRTLRRVARLADELLGEPAHDDEPARPGLMARVAGIERRVAAIDGRLTRVEDQVLPNGGSSLHDKVCRIEQATGAGD